MVMALSRRMQFAGKGRLLDLVNLGPGNKTLVPKGVSTVNCLHGIKIETDRNRDVMFRELYVNGFYQGDVLIALHNLLEPGDVFWDIGANYGFMSIYAARVFEGKVQIVAFEPNPVVLNVLRRNVELNRCSNLRIEKICLSDRIGEVTFYTSENQSWNATMIEDFARAHGENVAVQVASSTIDESVKVLPPPSVIKLDVEGAEHLVIKGGSRFLRDASVPIIAEYNVQALQDVGLDREDYLGLFRDLGYEIYQFRRPLWGRHRWSDLSRVAKNDALPTLCNIVLLKDAPGPEKQS